MVVVVVHRSRVMRENESFWNWPRSWMSSKSMWSKSAGDVSRCVAACARLGVRRLESENAVLREQVLVECLGCHGCQCFSDLDLSPPLGQRKVPIRKGDAGPDADPL